MLLFRTFFLNSIGSLVAGGLGVSTLYLLAFNHGLFVVGVFTLVRAMMPHAGLALMDFGLNDFVVKSMSKSECTSRRRLKVMVASCFLLAVIYTLIGSVGFLTVTFLFQDQTNVLGVERPLLQAIFLVMPFLALGFVGESILRGLQKFHLNRLLDICLNLSLFVFVLVTLQVLNLVDSLAIFLITAMLLKGVLTWFLVSRYLPGICLVEALFSIRVKDARHSVVRSKIYLFAKISAFSNHLPTFLISGMFGPADLGLFATISRGPNYLRNFISQSCSILFPLSIRHGLTRSANVKGVDQLTLILSTSLIFIISFSFFLLPVLAEYLDFQLTRDIEVALIIKLCWIWLAFKCGLITLLCYGNSAAVFWSALIALLNSGTAIAISLILILKYDFSSLSFIYGECVALAVSFLLLSLFAKKFIPTLKYLQVAEVASLYVAITIAILCVAN